MSYLKSQNTSFDKILNNYCIVLLNIFLVDMLLMDFSFILGNCTIYKFTSSSAFFLFLNTFNTIVLFLSIFFISIYLTNFYISFICLDSK